MTDENRLEVHLLETPAEEYGDALLCRFGSTTVLIDGGHEGDLDLLLEQYGEALGTDPPFHVDLLVISHAHEDHIGCLPSMVGQHLDVDFALVPDPVLAWGGQAGLALLDSLDDEVRMTVLALREEIPSDPTMNVDAVRSLIARAAKLRPYFEQLIECLSAANCTVIRFGADDHSTLENHFSSIGMEVLGPSQDQVNACAERMFGEMEEVVRKAISTSSLVENSAVDLYLDVLAEELALNLDARPTGRAGPLINLQSSVLGFTFAGCKLLFYGDSQLLQPERAGPEIREMVEQLKAKVIERGPYNFVKAGHHASPNSFDAAFAEALAAPAIGICAGPGDKLPNQDVLRALADRLDVTWARTDRNGHSVWRSDGEKPGFTVSRRSTNDASPPGHR